MTWNEKSSLSTLWTEGGEMCARGTVQTCVDDLAVSFHTRGGTVQDYLEFAGQNPKVTTDGFVSYVAGYNRLFAVHQNRTLLFERTEDFGQEVTAITMDGGPYSQAWRDDNSPPYIFVGFGDNFVRAYNQTPLRTRAGNVGHAISGLALRENGDIIVGGNDENGGIIASWQNDLNDYHWRYTGLSGEVLDVAVDFGNQHIFVLLRDSNEVRRLDENGNNQWTTSLANTPSAFDLSNSTVFVREDGGTVELLSLVDGSQKTIHTPFSHGGLGDISQSCGDYLYIEDSGVVKRVRKEDGSIDWEYDFGAVSMASWPGPASSRMQDLCYVMEGYATERITASAEGIGQYDHRFVIPSGSNYTDKWPRDYMGASASPQGGLYEQIFSITEDPILSSDSGSGQGEEKVSAETVPQSGLLEQIFTYVYGPKYDSSTDSWSSGGQGEEKASAEATPTSGLLELIFTYVDLPGQGYEKVSAEATPTGGIYNEV